ncbi:hypothetical protein KFE25_004101 [Diacronema lutheri]|uniref:Protein kinase domain-containing protein n=1 Tax=Diacronema lutheri TaxID=2081491 RepID=A0A8J5XGS5_DIALT|nr:hypothetical protein KFE25_004101 [Diacronema lutheri]
MPAPGGGAHAGSQHGVIGRAPRGGNDDADDDDDDDDDDGGGGGSGGGGGGSGGDDVRSARTGARAARMLHGRCALGATARGAPATAVPELPRRGAAWARARRRGVQSPPRAPSPDEQRLAIIVREEAGQPSSQLMANFALGRLIGVGASAACYRCTRLPPRARARGPADVFAAKAISKAAATGGGADARARHVALARVRAEAVLLVGLRAQSAPASIIRIERAFESDEQFTLVLELCEGGELLSFLLGLAGQPVSETECGMVLSQLSCALAFLHAHRIAHRDLKPENVLLRKSGRLDEIKLCDFGSAATCDIEGDAVDAVDAVDAAAPAAARGAPRDEASEGAAVDSRWADFAPTPPPERWRRAALVGTPGYLAPEVRQGGMSGCGVDVWAMGVIAFLMLASELPFCPERDTRPLAGGNESLLCEYALNLESGKMAVAAAHAKRTVRAMLEPQQQLRCTAQHVADTPWVRGPAGSTPDERVGARADGAACGKGVRRAGPASPRGAHAGVRAISPGASEAGRLSTWGAWLAPSSARAALS